jgi:pimeloyl-ACP methyl ester carboxylesterase
MDARVWGRVIPLLTAKGHAATAVNLPGHGADATPASELSLDGYVAAAVSAIGKDKIVLVGHSMAGMVISAVAEKIPIQIERLVYVAAYLPRNGESLYQISQEDSDSHIGKFWRQEDPAHYSPAWIADEGIAECFAADASPEVISLLVKNHKPEALGPMATPVTLTAERFGKVVKHYIHTTKDNAVSFALQKKMVARVGVTRTSLLETSHTPFFSQPEALTEKTLL